VVVAADTGLLAGMLARLKRIKLAISMEMSKLAISMSMALVCCRMFMWLTSYYGRSRPL